MKENISVINKGRLVLLIFIVWVFSLLFYFIAPLATIIIEHEIFINFKYYKKEWIKVDTIFTHGISEDGRYVFVVGHANNKIIGKFGSGRYDIKDYYNIVKNHERNKKYLNIWVSPNTRNAYFDSPPLDNTTQLQLWYRPLTELGIFIFFTILYFGLNRYFKRELLKYGLTPKEYSKLSKEKKLDEYLKNYERQN